MRVAMICFTARGADTAARIREALEGGRCPERGEIPADGECSNDRKASVRVWCAKSGFSQSAGGASLTGVRRIEPLQKPLRRWTEEAFAEYEALVFVGATGIAVRSVAPFLKSKTSDPAVLCVDELGKFVIPLVSGHIGGANELAARLAEELGAVAVITTATDLNGRFAVDVFARKNRMWISDMRLAKRISAELLDGHEAGFCSDFPWDGELPEGLAGRSMETYGTGPGQPGGDSPEYGICVSLDTGKQPFAHTLYLVPQIAVLGLGCRRGKSPEELERFVRAVLAGNRVSEHALCMVCSHAVKADERALLEFCEARGLPFQTYTAEELQEARGSFSASRFVEARVGVDNVCERSAVLGSGGELLIPKTAENGMTAALALKRWKLSFR